MRAFLRPLRDAADTAFFIAFLAACLFIWSFAT